MERSHHDELLIGIMMVGLTATVAAVSLLWLLFTRPELTLWAGY